MPIALGISIDFKTLSIDIGAPSTEFWGPMAQAVSFGLLFATMLTLVIVPVMYLAQQNSTDWIAEKAHRVASLLKRPQKAQRYGEPEGELL